MTKEDILNELQKIASSPKAQLQKYLGAGKKVIGCVPVYTPEELIHSMGLVPMGLWGADIQIKDAKNFFPAFICSIMQSVLELGMKGSYKGLSAIVVPSLCDSLKCIGQNWKYAVPEIPFIPMTYPQNRVADFGITFTEKGYLIVIKELERICGVKFDEESLKKSIEIYNTHNELMREFSSLAAETEITPRQRSAVFKSALFMLKEEHNGLMRELNDALTAEKQNGKTAQTDKIRVVTSGILADNGALLKILEDNNIIIAGDDVAAESRQYRTDCCTQSPPLRALAEKFAHMDCCSVLYDADKKRADLITDLAADRKADGVIVMQTKFCDPEEFDYVIIKEACAAKKIPHIIVEIDRQMTNYDQARTIIQSFAEMCR
ncbi:MAG: 2-hydroxyacyl-CoA dehydratase subunit D [Treponema sp.]|uniref:2-hydroxyacyl-CoA dehydratase subunit D n=1 Tax=Treponema sp. TaxID=166 RepID=UPI003FA1D8E3